MVVRISITMQNLVEIERCTSAWEDKEWCYSLFLNFVTLPPVDSIGNVVSYFNNIFGIYRPI